MTTPLLRRVLVMLVTGLLLAGVQAGAATINVPADQPTIAAAIAVAAPGDVIDVAPGTYNERIDIPKGLDDLTVQGRASGGTTLEGTPPSGGNVVRVRADRVLLQDFIIRGGNTAVRLEDSSGSVVRFLTIENSRKGIHVTKGEGTEVSDCVIVDAASGPAVDVSDAENVSIVGVWTINPRRGGIRVKSSPGAYVHANAVDDARGGDGIRLHGIVNGTVDLSLIYNSARTGLRISRSPGIVVENNQVDYSGGYGIRVDHSPPIATVTELQDAGNACADNRRGDFLVVP